MNINDTILKISKELNISIASIARSINESPQNFNNKLKRGSLSLEELEAIAKTLNINFNSSFTVNNEKLNITSNSIENKDVLEFSIFCIERLKDNMMISGIEAYELLAEKTNVLYSYIIRHYDVLHTLDETYILDDLRRLVYRGGV